MREFRDVFMKYASLLVSFDELTKEVGAGLHVEKLDAGFIVHVAPDLAEPIIIFAAQLAQALDRFVGGHVAADELEVWANLLILLDVYKVADDVVEKERSQILSALHELATPRIFGAITHAHVQMLKRRLVSCNS